MAITNSLKKQLDLPTWEHLRFAPAVSAAGSVSCSADNSHYHEEFGRYIYHLIGSTSFWRYDTWEDTYIQLSSPPIAILTWASTKFSGAYGFEGRVLSASSSSFTAPAYYGQALKGYDVRIISGTGAGQQRKITGVADAVEGASGTVTAVSATTLTDSTKSWTINQWAGYQVRIKYGTGVGQVRRILHNDATSLTFVDVNRCAVDYNANPAPFSPALSATAGAQSVYAIESSVISIDSNWAVTPDETSKFRVFSGTVVLVSSAAATPFFTLQLYDILSDTWYIRSSTTNIASAVGTDGNIERTTENASVWSKGTATGGSTTTLIDSTQSWTTNEHTGKWVRIYSGTGEGQIMQVTSNTATTLTWATSGTAPDTTSLYLIDGFDAGTATSATSITLVDSTKSWATNEWKNFLVRIVFGTGAGQTLPILSNTGTTLTTYKPWATTPDNTSVYSIQGDKDNIYIFLAGQANVIVHSFESNLASSNRVYDDGLARLGSAQYGSFPPVPITSGAGTSGTITVTTAIPHGFKTGWTISHNGDTGASAVANNIAAAITVTGATTYTYTAAGSTAAWTVGSHSTTTLKDASKNWTVNEHANKIVYFSTAAPVLASGLTACVAMEVASNTANTLTFKTATTAPTNGVSRYLITERVAIGALDSGIATGSQSTTTLQDTSKSWGVNQWAGRKLKMLSGTGQSIEIAITSNTSNTLTFGTTTAPVAASTSYAILGGTTKGLGLGAIWNFGVSDLTKRGKYLYISRGGAVHGFDRLNISTDSWDIMSIFPQIETLTTGSMYTYDAENKLYFTKDATLRVYYLDLITNQIHGAGLIPYIAGTATVGNRMEVFETSDKLKFLWVNRHSGAECYRRLLF